jgi:ABC-type phosphate/phosphonate transport system substrate-binding protein
MHVVPLRFGLPPGGPLDPSLFRDVADLVRDGAGLWLELVPLPSYAALADAIERGTCDAAWAPPLVALSLQASHAARTVAAVQRDGRTWYHAALVAEQAGWITRLRDLAHARVGWVARESAAGYVVPRLHVESMGVVPAGFGDEVFLGSHAAAAAALGAGEVDVIATHARVDEARRVVPRDVGFPVRVLSAAGPIPADVVVARLDLGRATTSLLGAALEAASRVVAPRTRDGRTIGFVRAGAEHLEPLRHMHSHTGRGVTRLAPPSLD